MAPGAILFHTAIAVPAEDFVRHHRMAGVGQVFDEHFPIAVVQVAQHAAGDFQPADRRAIHHVVDGREAVAEIVLEIGPDVVQLGENEAAIVFDVGHRRDARNGMALLEPGVLVALAQRNEMH